MTRLERAPLVHDPDVAGHDEGVCWYVDEMWDLKDVAVDFGEDGDVSFVLTSEEVGARIVGAHIV